MIICKSHFFGIGIRTARLQSSRHSPVCHIVTISLCSKDIPKSPLALIIYADISSHPVALPFLSYFTANSTNDLRGMSSSSSSSVVSLDLPCSLSSQYVVLAPVLPYFVNKPSRCSFYIAKILSFAVSVSPFASLMTF